MASDPHLLDWRTSQNIPIWFVNHAITIVFTSFNNDPHAPLYPQFAELRSRGWSKSDLQDLAGGNFVRVWEGVEAVSKRMLKEGVHHPAYDIYEKRKNI